MLIVMVGLSSMLVGCVPPSSENASDKDKDNMVGILRERDFFTAYIMKDKVKKLGLENDYLIDGNCEDDIDIYRLGGDEFIITSYKTPKELYNTLVYKTQNFKYETRKKLGYSVTVFEALHEIGGVLKYGIPEFRLPNHIVDVEIEGLRQMGVHFEKDCIIGKTITVEQLEAEGYKGVFIASGAGLPNFMNIPGENSTGIFSSNEYLTRVNLMDASNPETDTPVIFGKRVAVIGGGNTAMDSVRTALRLGAERAMIIYRRSEEEMPARLEEVKHAKEEGVEFLTLHNPIEYIADEKGRVKQVVLQKMELGEPDASGRRSPVEKAGSDFVIDCDVVIMALGTSPNPLIASTTGGLNINRRGCIEANEMGATSREGVFAGGDAVTGAATVILAMGAGRKAAKAIDEYIKSK